MPLIAADAVGTGAAVGAAVATTTGVHVGIIPVGVARTVAWVFAGTITV